MASEPARARLLWAILSLVLPVTFGTVCRSPALALAAAIHFAMKCSASCSPTCAVLLVLDCSRLLDGVDAKGSEVVQEIPHPLFFLAPHTARALHQFSKYHALRSLVSSMRVTNPANKIRLLREVA